MIPTAKRPGARVCVAYVLGGLHGPYARMPTCTQANSAGQGAMTLNTGCCIIRDHSVAPQCSQQHHTSDWSYLAPSGAEGPSGVRLELALVPLAVCLCPNSLLHWPPLGHSPFGRQLLQSAACVLRIQMWLGRAQMWAELCWTPRLTQEWLLSQAGTDSSSPET